MASAAEGGGRSSVRRYISALVAANLLVLLVVGIGGIVATIRAHNSVHYLTEQVEPVARANAAMLQVIDQTVQPEHVGLWLRETTTER